MGYGADVAPFLCHAEATAMRAVCVQVCYAIERVPGWPTPAAARTKLDLSCNQIGDAGAAALAAQLQVRVCLVVMGCMACFNRTRQCYYCCCDTVPSNLHGHFVALSSDKL